MSDTMAMMMSPKLDWAEFLSLYSQINNSPSMSPSSSPRPTARFENYLFSPEKIRETCSRKPHRTRPSPRGRASHPAPSIASSSASRSGSTHSYATSSHGSDRSHSPSSSSSSSSSRSLHPRCRDLSYPHSSPPSSRSGSTHSYAPAHGRNRSYSPSSSSSSSRSSNPPYKYIPPAEKDRHGNYMYLPLRDSLRILSDVQDTLEYACYSYGDRHLPEVLEENGWDCPEAVELNTWVSVFFKPANFDLLSHDSKQTGNTKDLGDLLQSIRQIRHSTVHRHRLTVVTIKTMIKEAIAFCRILEEHTYYDKLHTIFGAAQIQIDELYEKYQPCPPPKPSILQIPSTPKLLPESQRETSTEEDDRSTEAGSEYTESSSTTSTTFSKEHLFWQGRTW